MNQSSPDAREERLNEIIAEFFQTAEAGGVLDPSACIARHPEFAEELGEFFADRQQFAHLGKALELPDGPAAPSEPEQIAGTDAPTLSPGEIVEPAQGTKVRYFGDYELLEEIARGGMGIVYKARQVSLRRIVALKMILGGQLASPEDVQRFHREAETAAGLQHPNIVAIHEVGEYHGQYYFSMDYVEGQSLAQMVREAPLPAAQAARYVTIAARAIAYAHTKGILHRDLKPSNVLIDTNDQARVTDFGLAKRVAAPAGESGHALTITGAVLGTPSYMPPEQASADRGIVGVASDVYSLGAVLYELVVGRPPFRAATPIDTIMQVLDTEPASPRLLNPQVPRDLETVILKCLAKDPAQRYGTAEELADDLEAFVDGRPVQARRPSPPELAVRWVRRQKRSVALALAAAAAMAVVITLGLLGWAAYRQWQLGYLGLETNEVALVADILDDQGQTVVPRVGIPTAEEVALPAGSYRLRVSGRRTLSQDYQIIVEHGQPQSFQVGLDERQLWEPLRVPSKFELLEFQGKTDLMLLNEKGVSRLNGATREVVWEADLGPKSQPAQTGIGWDWRSPPLHSYVDWSPWLVNPALDLDGDGIGDAVFALRHQAALLALSGKDGKVLWCYIPEREGTTTRVPQTTTLGPPAVFDVDGDGTPDLIVSFALSTDTPRDPSRAAVRWVDAISGRTGKRLWRRPLDDAWFVLPEETAGRSRSGLSNVAKIHSDSRWFLGTTSGSSSSGGSLNNSGDEYHRWPGFFELSGNWALVPFPPQMVSLGSKRLTVFMAGTRLVGLDARTGEKAWVYDVVFLPARPPQFADLDGDGMPEALLVRSQPPSGQCPLGTSDLVTLSLQTGKQLWQASVEAEWGAYVALLQDKPADWPILADLDGDGRAEVIVPHGRPILSRFWNQSHIAGIAVLDGVTGQQRWHSTLKTIDDQIHRFLVGPDIDGDGHRDLFVASIGTALSGRNVKLALTVEALSGKDGHALWIWSQAQKETPSLEGLGIGPLLWWQAGADGWPELVVPYRPRAASGPVTIYVFATGTGQLAHVGMDLANPVVADLDGDGAPELLTYRPKYASYANHGGGDLYAFRGNRQEFWRKLGGEWIAAPDLNGDGVADLLRTGGGKVQANSGQDGKLLWGPKGYEGYVPVSLAPTQTDLDGDGIADILLVRKPSSSFPSGKTPLLKALSGKDGHVLWTSDLQLDACLDVPVLECRDLDGDGRPEVIVAAAGIWGSRQSGVQLRLAVLSGQSGAVRWQQTLSAELPKWGGTGWNDPSHAGWTSYSSWWDGRPDGFLKSPTRIHLGVADLDGDCIQDVIVPAVTSEKECELRALNGRDGTELWRRPLAARENNYVLLTGFPIPAIGDLDGDGKPEVVILDYSLKPGFDPAKPWAWDTKNGHVLVLNGADGSLKWAWQEDFFAGSGRIGNNESERLKPALRPRPLLVKLADQPSRLGICVWAWSSVGTLSYFDINSGGSGGCRESPGKIIVLGADGRERRRFSGDPAQAKVHDSEGLGAFGVWNYDLDGDGMDELVLIKEGKVTAVSPARQQPLWEWPLPKDPGTLVSIEPAGKDGQATVVVQSGDRLYGLSGRTGKPRWRSETFSGSASQIASLALLRAMKQHGLPRILYYLSNQTVVCRQAVPLEPAVESAASDGSTDHPLAGAVFDDPRRVRFSWHARPASLPSPADCATQSLLTVFVLVLPGFLVIRLLRGASLNWSRLLAAALFLAFGVGVVWFLIPSSSTPGQMLEGFISTFGFGIAIVAFFSPLILWTSARRWRRVVLLLVLFAVTSGLSFALPSMRDHFGEARFQSWTFWYVLLLPATCGAGGVMLLFFGVSLAFHAARRGWRYLWAPRWRPASA
jgi:outer membrane protein assembly factor BamB/tRNA A-37 threonylcarbamoyl transferase component Bud32